jgi:hypothetical protein
MKVYNAERRASCQLRSTINNTLDTHERYSGCYFWINTGNAASRRREEKNFAESNPPYEVKVKQGTISVTHSLDISCKNFYYSLEILLDGEKKDVRTLKKLIN